MKTNFHMNQDVRAPLLDEIPEAIVLSDSSTRVLYANKAAARILGLPHDELSNAILSERVHSEDKRKVTGYAKLLQSEKRLRTRRRFKDSTGEYVLIERNTQLMDDGTQLSICRRIAPQTALREDEVQARYATIAAEELRSSLAGIELYVNLITTSILEKMPQANELTTFLHRAQQQISRHERVIGNALNIQLLRDGVIDLKKEWFELEPFITEAVFQSRIIKEREIALSIAPTAPRQVYADKDRLYQALMSAFAIAVQRAEPFRPLEVYVTGTNTTFLIDIAYRDRHDPVSKPEQSAAFSLLRRSIALHDGTLDDLEADDSEKIMRISLPITEAEPIPVGTVEKTHPIEGSTARILIVDDNTIIADGLKRLLVHFGHDAHSSYSGRSAFKAVEQVKPDFVLLDINLPDLDGLRVATELRTLCPDAKLIAISGYDRRTYDEKDAARFDAYLTKPVGISDILKAIGDLQNQVPTESHQSDEH